MFLVLLSFHSRSETNPDETEFSLSLRLKPADFMLPGDGISRTIRLQNQTDQSLILSIADIESSGNKEFLQYLHCSLQDGDRILFADSLAVLSEKETFADYIGEMPREQKNLKLFLSFDPAATAALSGQNCNFAISFRGRLKSDASAESSSAAVPEGEQVLEGSEAPGQAAAPEKEEASDQEELPEEAEAPGKAVIPEGTELLNENHIPEDAESSIRRKLQQYRQWFSASDEAETDTETGTDRKDTAPEKLDIRIEESEGRKHGRVQVMIGESTDRTTVPVTVFLGEPDQGKTPLFYCLSLIFLILLFLFFWKVIRMVQVLIGGERHDKGSENAEERRKNEKNN